MAKGKFIVFEGTDGSGKGTQVNLLMQSLESLHIPFVHVDFPDYQSPFGQLIGRALKGEFTDPKSLDPYAFSSLYSLDRLLKRDMMVQALEEEKMIVANRYETANELFQSVKYAAQKEQDEFISWLRKIEFESMKLPRPDLVIYLHVPVEISQELVKQKNERQYIGKGQTDKHEQDISYQQAVQQKALELCEKELNWKKIDCVDQYGTLLPKEEIARKVWDIAESLIQPEFSSVA